MLVFLKVQGVWTHLCLQSLEQGQRQHRWTKVEPNPTNLMARVGLAPPACAHLALSPLARSPCYPPSSPAPPPCYPPLPPALTRNNQTAPGTVSVPNTGAAGAHAKYQSHKEFQIDQHALILLDGGDRGTILSHVRL